MTTNLEIKYERDKSNRSWNCTVCGEFKDYSRVLIRHWTINQLSRYLPLFFYSSRLFAILALQLQTIILTIKLHKLNCSGLGCVSLGKSESGVLIQDHSDHGASKEPTNPYPEWIRRFLRYTMIRVILDQNSRFGFSQRNAPFGCKVYVSD